MRCKKGLDDVPFIGVSLRNLLSTHATDLGIRCCRMSGRVVAGLLCVACDC